MGERIPLAATAVIGRVPDCDIQVTGEAASRRHALIHRLPDTGDWIVDLGSTNGVKVNGARITGSQRLRPRDRIELGRHTFTYRTEGPPNTQSKPGVGCLLPLSG